MKIVNQTINEFLEAIKDKSKQEQIDLLGDLSDTASMWAETISEEIGSEDEH